jgi:hypothetical protein
LSENKYDHKWETHSVIVPYKVRDSAWNFPQHDATNFYDYRDDAPVKYNED